MINDILINQCLAELNRHSIHKLKYKNYYEGHHSILKNYDMQDSRSNRKLIFNFPRKFIDNETGYLLGKPVNFISKSDDKRTLLIVSIETPAIGTRSII
jgi:hypothetical protein